MRSAIVQREHELVYTTRSSMIIIHYLIKTGI